MTQIREQESSRHEALKLPRPRLGFLGVGWIGRSRLAALKDSGAAHITAVSDISEAAVENIRGLIPGVKCCSSYEDMLSMNIDGVVIATPSALHASQAIMALEKNKAVFCQKPLGRNEFETRLVIETARRKDCLLGADLSYRHLKGTKKIKEMIGMGAAGKIFAADLIFHNAYGPDKAWFYDPLQSGGGCLIDLGTHLVDLVLWMFDNPGVDGISSRLFSKGEPLIDHKKQVEDYASAIFDLKGGPSVRLACSWKISAGCDAVIQAVFYGTKGAFSLKNINGSFYDFKTEHFNWTESEVIETDDRHWGPKALIDWSEKLFIGNKFDAEIEIARSAASVLDTMYGR